MEKFIKTIRWLAGGASTVWVLDIGLVKTEPVDKTTSDTLMLGEFIEFINNNAVDEAKIGRTRYGRLVAHKTEEFVE